MSHKGAELTRRGLLVPMGAGLVLSACAPLMPSPGHPLGPPGWREARAVYGTDPQQSLYIRRPQSGRAAAVLILTDPQPSKADEALAEQVADQGLVAVLAGRRQIPSGAFPTYTSDAARAVAWIGARSIDLGLQPGPIGILGLKGGVNPALMLAHDPRYLSAVGQSDQVSGVVVLGPLPPLESTFTHPDAYPDQRAGTEIWQLEEGQLQSAINRLKQHLIQP